MENILPIAETGVDVIGIRGAVCEDNNRISTVKAEKVRELKEKLC